MKCIVIQGVKGFYSCFISAKSYLDFLPMVLDVRQESATNAGLSFFGCWSMILSGPDVAAAEGTYSVCFDGGKYAATCV